MKTREQQISRLRELGWAVADMPGYRFADTLMRFQYAHLDKSGLPLEVDGEYGPVTEQALFDVYLYPSASFTERVLSVALSQVGIAEVPLGSNSGPQIDLILKSVGLSPGYAWCAAFTYWCFVQASRQLGIKNPCPKNAGVLNVWALAGYKTSGLTRITPAQAEANPALIKPGMQFLLKLSATAGHTGLIESVDYNSKYLTTIEGNSNSGGSREGVAVTRLTKRTIRSINLGFITYS